MLSDSRETSGGMWFLRKNNVAPANSALLVQIFNVGHAYASVEQFAFSVRNSSTDTWTELYAIQAPGTLYCCVQEQGQLDMVHQIQLDGGGLVRVLQSGAIPPQGHVSNWFLFEFPKGFKPSPMPRTRLEVWDHAGHKYDVESNAPNANRTQQEIPADVRDEMDRITLKAVSNPITNLKDVRVSHVADEN
jgi:hypothetical protein